MEINELLVWREILIERMNISYKNAQKNYICEHYTFQVIHHIYSEVIKVFSLRFIFILLVKKLKQEKSSIHSK